MELVFYAILYSKQGNETSHQMFTQSAFGPWGAGSHPYATAFRNMKNKEN